MEINCKKRPLMSSRSCKSDTPASCWFNWSTLLLSF